VIEFFTDYYRRLLTDFRRCLLTRIVSLEKRHPRAGGDPSLPAFPPGLRPSLRRGDESKVTAQPEG
jgi:hypothetical protein